MIRRELTYFLTALMFLTRLPVPVDLEYSAEIMNRSQRYYSLVGSVVGICSALIFYLANLVFSTEISVLLSMIGSIWLTGAFHEDGFTDVCDAFGGGYGKEKILQIMKDSRVGAYGVVGICLLLLLKFKVLSELADISPSLIMAALVAGHTASRFISSTMIYTHEYVQDTDKSKVRPVVERKPLLGELLFSGLWILLPFILLGNYWFLLALPVAYLAKSCLSYYFNKHIGGYTGDCLGAIQQVSEVTIYLALIALWKFF